MAGNESRSQSEIRALTEEWAKAIRAKDIDAVMRDYASDLTTFDVMPPLSSKGADAYRKSWQGFFDSIDGLMSVDMSDLQIVAGDDVAFLHCINQVGPANAPAAAHSVRVTVGFRKIGGRWKVVHEHVSVPLNTSGGNA